MAPGQVGTIRYAARVKGSPPLSLLPPVADLGGNVYVLNGAPALPETHAFVGFAGGGWSAGCSLTKGDQFGAHGWAGFASAREWYWSGAALVAISGADGTCHAVLDHDPSTAADLLFQAVVPWVRALSERTSLVALVQSPTDPAPFSALVDLDNEFLTNVNAFAPSDAQNVTIVGVGGSRDQQLGIVLVQYLSGGAANFEARYYDGDANLIGTVPLSGGPLAAYSVQGYLQIASSGRVAGLAASGNTDGSLVFITFDQSGGGVAPVSVMDPVGVHLWDGSLWLVGEQSSSPVVAPIDSQGNVGSVSTWNASLAAASAVAGQVSVRDDRSLPSRETSWSQVATAIGDFPLLSPHTLTEQAPGTTLWLFAGPSFQSTGFTITSVGMAPVGVSYP